VLFTDETRHGGNVEDDERASVDLLFHFALRCAASGVNRAGDVALLVDHAESRDVLWATLRTVESHLEFHPDDAALCSAHELLVAAYCLGV
jgi:hypothetical protein